MSRGQNAKQTYTSIKELLPLVVGVLLMILMVEELGFFTWIVQYIHNTFGGTVLFAVLGSLMTGNPLNSYIIIHSLPNFQDSIVMFSAFLLAWVTVGFVQMPAEIYFFGKKFTFWRNGLAFVFSLGGCYIVYFLYILLGNYFG